MSHLRTALRLPIELEIESGAVPKTLVAMAIRSRDDAERQAHARRNSSLRFDEVWCVFDVDTHPGIAEAKQQANANGIRVAVSNPCFELWVLLHFQDQTAYLDTKAAQHLCRKHIPKYEKALPCGELLPHYPEALRRARDLEHWQRSRDNEGGNPSTQVHLLVEWLRSFRRT